MTYPTLFDVALEARCKEMERLLAELVGWVDFAGRRHMGSFGIWKSGRLYQEATRLLGEGYHIPQPYNDYYANPPYEGYPAHYHVEMVPLGQEPPSEAKVAGKLERQRKRTSPCSGGSRGEVIGV